MNIFAPCNKSSGFRASLQAVELVLAVTPDTRKGRFSFPPPIAAMFASD